MLLNCIVDGIPRTSGNNTEGPMTSAVLKVVGPTVIRALRLTTSNSGNIEERYYNDLAFFLHEQQMNGGPFVAMVTTVRCDCIRVEYDAVCCRAFVLRCFPIQWYAEQIVQNNHAVPCRPPG